MSSGSYQDVCGGGGQFVDRPSPPNARAAASVLRAAGQASSAAAAKKMSVLRAVEPTVEGMEGLPRCDPRWKALRPYNSAFSRFIREFMS